MAKMVGGCLCGSIRYCSDAEPALTCICHCTHCQKQTGTAFSILVAVPKGRAASNLNCNTSSPDEVPGWKFARATSKSSPKNVS
jgi:hypothetical protein